MINIGIFAHILKFVLEHKYNFLNFCMDQWKFVNIITRFLDSLVNSYVNIFFVYGINLQLFNSMLRISIFDNVPKTLHFA